jgi:deoxyinosine 3'endonuclease (endonuclease V)
MVQLTAPYIPGFLAFREAHFLVEKINKMKKNKEKCLPQVKNKTVKL